MSVTPPADTKPWYASTTVWGAVLAIAVPLVATFFKVQIDAATSTDLANWLAALGGLVGGAIAIWGRLHAVTPITGSPAATTTAPK